MARAGLLFDLDGTLVDTDPLHLAAFAAVLNEAGLGPLTLEAYHARVMGHPNSDIAAFLFPARDDALALVEEKERRFRRSLEAEVEPLAGILELLDWAEAEGVATAVVTNAPRANAEAMLAAAGLAGRLTELVIGEECARPKPDPLPYVEAMRRLGVVPSHALAFEDSLSGLSAARGSGATVFGMTTGLPADRLLQAGAHHAIRDFRDPALLAALPQLKARVA